MKEHTITHMDACSLSSLMARGILDTLTSQGSPIKVYLWKTLTMEGHFVLFSHRSVQESLRPGF